MNQEQTGKKDTKIKKLIAQIMKFGVVGLISFIVDFSIYTIICNVMGISYLIAGFAGFTISVIVNYILSMHFVFESRNDLSKTKEFIIFVFLSVVGLGVNELILYLCIDVIYANWNWLSSWLSIKPMNLLAKVAATGIVMIYNFVSRKLCLEKKEAEA